MAEDLREGIISTPIELSESEDESKSSESLLSVIDLTQDMASPMSPSYCRKQSPTTRVKGNPNMLFGPQHVASRSRSHFGPMQVPEQKEISSMHLISQENIAAAAPLQEIQNEALRPPLRASTGSSVENCHLSRLVSVRPLSDVQSINPAVSTNTNEADSIPTLFCPLPKTAAVEEEPVLEEGHVVIKEKREVEQKSEEVQPDSKEELDSDQSMKVRRSLRVPKKRFETYNLRALVGLEDHAPKDPETAANHEIEILERWRTPEKDPLQDSDRTFAPPLLEQNEPIEPTGVDESPRPPSRRRKRPVTLDEAASVEWLKSRLPISASSIRRATESIEGAATVEVESLHQGKKATYYGRYAFTNATTRSEDK